MLEDDFERMMRNLSPPDPEIALHISISSGQASSGSEVWLAVTLTNLASYPSPFRQKDVLVPLFITGFGSGTYATARLAVWTLDGRKRTSLKRI